MSHITEAETHVAKKQHRCTWCWQFIQPGETYKRYRYYSEGEAGTVKLHPECKTAVDDAAYEEGGFVEWTPGEGERPQPVV